jgi:hypothetical protein
MGVLRALALAILASGCTEVVVDPFDVQVDPPPVLVDLFIHVEGAFEVEGAPLHVYLPELGQVGSESVIMGRATFNFRFAIEAGTPTVLVAGFFDRDYDGCCLRELDPSFAEEVELQHYPDDEFAIGTVEFAAMAPLPLGTCPFFESGDPVCMRMEMPGP